MKGPYRHPLLLAVMTLVGLVLALLAEGVWDVLALGLLLLPVGTLGVTLIMSVQRRRKQALGERQ